MKKKPLLCSKCKNNTQGGRFESGREDLIVVDAKSLATTISNETCFIAVNGPIRLVLDHKHPLRANWFNTRRWIYHIPSAVLQKRVDLRDCSLLPQMSIRSLHCFMI